MSLKKVGEIIPLVATLECPGAGPFYVRAVVEDKVNALIATISLDDQGNGEFNKYTFVMPDEDLIKIRYEIFDDVIHTLVNQDFCPAAEVFCKLETIGGTIQIFREPKNMKLKTATKNIMKITDLEPTKMASKAIVKSKMKIKTNLLKMKEVDIKTLPFKMGLIQ